MNSFTLPQRLEIVQLFYQNSRSFVGVQRAYRALHGRHSAPSVLAIRRIIQKLESEFTLLDTKPPNRTRTERSVENIAAVQASVEESANVSITRRAQSLGLSRMTTWRIMRLDLGLHPYKMVLAQELKPNDHRLRREFANWALESIENDPDFHRKIIFSDEAHFWLNGFVNKQNCRYWCKENPHMVHSSPLYPEKLTVWCGLWYGGIIGPFFFKNAENQTVTVNGERYRAMLTDFFFPEFDDIDGDDLYFQQDGATCHTSGETMDLLRGKFGEAIISRNGPFNWPPRSCDLTPLDYFLWGYVKSKVYANNPSTIQELETNIRATIAAIPLEMLHRVIENWTERIEACKKSRGGHLADILFKS